MSFLKAVSGTEATMDEVGWSGVLIGALLLANVVVFVGLLRDELRDRRTRRRRNLSTA
jgi:hypothetical protein